jgi:hypothetical protein
MRFVFTRATRMIMFSQAIPNGKSEASFWPRGDHWRQLPRGKGWDWPARLTRDQPPAGMTSTLGGGYQSLTSCPSSPVMRQELAMSEVFYHETASEAKDAADYWPHQK